mgnify:FL=1
MNSKKAHWLLVALTIIWGYSFIAISDAAKTLAPETLLFWRFLIASGILTVMAIMRKARLPWKEGTIAGIMFSISYLAQTVGLVHTNASVAAFITGLLVIFTPMCEGIMNKKAPSVQVWISSLIALGGTYLLVGGASGSSSLYGIILLLICSIGFSIHLVYIGDKNHLDPIAFVAVQCLVMTLFFSVLAMGNNTFAWPGAGLRGVLFLALLATALGLSLQVYAQKYIPPSKASLIFSLEPVFATIFAAIILGEAMTKQSLIGMALIFLATIIVEIEFNWQTQNETSQQENGL